MDLFAKGSIWRHRTIDGCEVHIATVDPVNNTYTLSWVLPSDPLSKSMLFGNWTALDLVRDFTPVFPHSRWNVLLWGEDPFSEEKTEADLADL